MTENSKSLAHPQTWRWEEDGNAVAGTYLRMDEANTEYGRKAILVRPTGDFMVGERITITRGAEKVESGAGRMYWPYRVTFPDAPTISASAILGATGTTTSSTPAEPEPELPAGDDPLPF